MVKIKTAASVLFIIAVLFTAFFYSKSAFFASGHWQIETDLRSLVPVTREQQLISSAVDKLAQSSQQQLLFLVTLPEGEDAGPAGASLAESLSAITGIALADEQQLQQQLVEFVSQHRFQLLTPEQRAALNSSATNTELAQDALQEKYSITATPQILAFADDPLAWHSQFLLSVLALLDQTQTLPDHQFLLSARVDADAFGMSGQADVLQKIMQAELHVTDDYANSRIEHSGVFFYAAAAASESRADITRITSISGLAVVALLIWVFRSISPVIFPVVTVGFGVACAFALVHSWFGNVHILTIVFGASLIGVVVDYSIHSFFHAAESSDYNKLHKALLLSLLTSLVGYSALAYSQLPALSQVAFFSCAGMLAAWLAVVVLSPLLVKNISPRKTQLVPMLAACQRLFARLNGKFVGLLAALIVVLGGISIWLKPGSDNPALFFTPNPSVLAMDKSIAEQVGQYEPGTFVIFSGSDEQTVADQTNAFLQQVDQHPRLATGDFLSLTQLLPSARDQTANYRAQQRLYETNGVLEAFYRLVGLDETALQQQRQSYLSASDQQVSIQQMLIALPDLLPPLWQEANGTLVNIVLVQQGTDLVAVQNLIEDTGNGVLYRALQHTQNALSQQKSSALSMLLLAYFLVAGFLLWFYKKPSALVIVFIPLTGTALLLCCFALMSIDLNLFHVCASFLILGLGLDYGIFVYQMRDNQSTTEQAVLVSAFTSLLSFGLLAFSNVPVVNSFGWALVIANSVNFIGALIFSAKLRAAANQPAAG